jgi:hypothetical protein
MPQMLSRSFFLLELFFIVLVESWDQCKDADVLLESPSAMAGVHIAEALRKLNHDRSSTLLIDFA